MGIEGREQLMRSCCCGDLQARAAVLTPHFYMRLASKGIMPLSGTLENPLVHREKSSKKERIGRKGEPRS
jgi:hypothetical protein